MGKKKQPIRITCPTCGGACLVWTIKHRLPEGEGRTWEVCPQCKGTGRVDG